MKPLNPKGARARTPPSHPFPEVVSTQPFDGLASALASLIGSSPEAAGLLLGLVTVFLLTFAVMLFLDKGEMEVGYVFAAVAMSFVVGVEWWPTWTVIFIVFIILFAIINPFERG